LGFAVEDSVSVDLDGGRGVGEGFGATARGRVVDEFVFCAINRVALASTIETITRNLFTIV